MLLWKTRAHFSAMVNSVNPASRAQSQVGPCHRTLCPMIGRRVPARHPIDMKQSKRSWRPPSSTTPPIPQPGPRPDPEPHPGTDPDVTPPFNPDPEPDVVPVPLPEPEPMPL